MTVPIGEETMQLLCDKGYETLLMAGRVEFPYVDAGKDSDRWRSGLEARAERDGLRLVQMWEPDGVDYWPWLEIARKTSGLKPESYMSVMFTGVHLRTRTRRLPKLFESEWAEELAVARERLERERGLA